MAESTAEVGVAPIGWRIEGLLDHPRGDPAQQVEHRTGLVVGAGGAGPPEGLLADHSAGGLVVDVEVAGGVVQRVGGLDDRRAIPRSVRPLRPTTPGPRLLVGRVVDRDP